MFFGYNSFEALNWHKSALPPKEDTVVLLWLLIPNPNVLQKQTLM